MTTLRETARDLFDLVDRNAREAGDQPVPQATVDALADAGLHAVMTPRAVGGLEASVVDAIDVFAEIARADGSAGWCLMANAATIAFFGAWAPDDFAKTLFADGVPLAAGQFAPNGIATPEGDGYRITGDYHFGSGVRHSAWVGAGVVTAPADGTDAQLLLRADAGRRGAVHGELGRARAREHRELGLLDRRRVGAGERDVRFLRAGAAAGQCGVRARRDGPHVGRPRRVRARGRAARARRAHRDRAIEATDGVVGRAARQRALPHRAGQPRSRAPAPAASWVRERFAAAERTALETGSADPTEIALARQATVHATQDGADVVRRAYLLAGTDALRAGPLQTCFRDIHAGSQHFFAGDLAGIELGRALLAD